MSTIINLYQKETSLNNIFKNTDLVITNDNHLKNYILNESNNSQYIPLNRFTINDDNTSEDYDNLLNLYSHYQYNINSKLNKEQVIENIKKYNNYIDGVQNSSYIDYNKKFNTHSILLNSTYNTIWFLQKENISLMSYIINPINGFNYYNHMLYFNIDNNFIKSVNNKLYYDFNQIPYISNYQYGVAKINEEQLNIKENSSLNIDSNYKYDMFVSLSKLKSLYNNCNDIYSALLYYSNLNEYNNKSLNFNYTYTYLTNKTYYEIKINFDQTNLYYTDYKLNINSLNLTNVDTIYVSDLSMCNFTIGYIDSTKVPNINKYTYQLLKPNIYFNIEENNDVNIKLSYVNYYKDINIPIALQYIVTRITDKNSIAQSTLSGILNGLSPIANNYTNNEPVTHSDEGTIPSGPVSGDIPIGPTTGGQNGPIGDIPFGLLPIQREDEINNFNYETTTTEDTNQVIRGNKYTGERSVYISENVIHHETKKTVVKHHIGSTYNLILASEMDKDLFKKYGIIASCQASPYLTYTYLGNNTYISNITIQTPKEITIKKIPYQIVKTITPYPNIFDGTIAKQSNKYYILSSKNLFNLNIWELDDEYINCENNNSQDLIIKYPLGNYDDITLKNICNFDFDGEPGKIARLSKNKLPINTHIIDYLKSHNLLISDPNLYYYKCIVNSNFKTKTNDKQTNYEYYPILNTYPNQYINDKFFDSNLYNTNFIPNNEELSTCISDIKNIDKELDQHKLFMYEISYEQGENGDYEYFINYYTILKFWQEPIDNLGMTQINVGILIGDSEEYPEHYERVFGINFYPCEYKNELIKIIDNLANIEKDNYRQFSSLEIYKYMVDFGNNSIVFD